MKAAFANTGLEYPEIVDFVKEFDVKILRPEIPFNRVIQKNFYMVMPKGLLENSLRNGNFYLMLLLKFQNNVAML